MTPRPLKVLLSAYACEPDKGSEPGIGWNYALQLARFHEVWVVTRANNRGPIEAALRESPCPTLRPVYHDLPRWAMWWKRGGRGVHVYYYLWQSSLFFVARRLVRQVDFDVVHHVTFGRYWVPTPLCLLRRPFVWGPVGGADAIPRAFRGALSLNGRVRNALRDLVRHVAEIDPLLRYCARRSTLALATTPATQTRLARLGAPSVQLMAAVGVPEHDALRLSRYSRSDDGEATFISVGNLLHWKGFEFGIRAFARAGLEGSRYVLIGDGPERRRLERVALELGVDRRVRFLGRLPREEVLAALEACHALVHPSTARLGRLGVPRGDGGRLSRVVSRSRGAGRPGRRWRRNQGSGAYSGGNGTRIGGGDAQAGRGRLSPRAHGQAG